MSAWLIRNLLSQNSLQGSALEEFVQDLKNSHSPLQALCLLRMTERSTGPTGSNLSSVSQVHIQFFSPLSHLLTHSQTMSSGLKQNIPTDTLLRYIFKAYTQKHTFSNSLRNFDKCIHSCIHHPK